MMRFAQAPVIRKFINLCTEKRKQALNVAERNVWKLIMNSVYGKFIENRRRHFRLNSAQPLLVLINTILTIFIKVTAF